MKKLAVVFGVAAVATITGCKDPDYVGRTGGTTQDEPKQIATEPAPQPAKPVTVTPIAVKHCTCLAGTKHASPCQCGAPDCACVVVAKPLPPPPPPPAIEPEYTIYIVQNGDILSKISKKFNVTIGSIKRLNNMKSDMVRIGQKLKLPGKIDVGVQSVPTAAAPAGKASRKGYVSYTGETKEYVVKNGDTLGAIAYGNGMNIRQLKELNGLKKDTLHVGQKLKVGVGGKAAKKSAPAKAEPAKTTAAKAEPVKAAQETKLATAAPATEPTAPAENAAQAPAAAPTAAEDEKAEPKQDSAPAAAPAVATQTYVVQEGDDITRVAIDFGLTPAQVRELNNLGENDTIKPGQVIKLPADAQQ